MVLAVDRSIQTGGNSFADSGGLKEAGPAPETEICYLNHKDARLRIIQLSPESQQGRARNSWKVESPRKEFASTISQIEIRNKPMRIEVSQYWPSICLQFWLRSDKTPKRLLRPPPPPPPHHNLSWINCCQLPASTN